MASRSVLNDDQLSPLVDRLRCLDCGGLLAFELAPSETGDDLGPDGLLRCTGCGRTYPVVAGTPRMLDRVDPENGAVRSRTAESFAYEWQHFGSPREVWAKNFADYLRPHKPEMLRGKAVLDVGTGSGRHAAQAALHGADVVAVDVGLSIDVARRNVPSRVLTVQADAERLPLEPESFDFVMSIGVLHHLPDPRSALRRVAQYASPGGLLHVYLYWVPERASHRALLGLVTTARRFTVRMPHTRLHALCYPIAGLLFVTAVGPQRVLRNRPRGRRIAASLPLKTYADYPFGVLVNDQFDRFSAPIEHRYTREQVAQMLRHAGLEEVTVLPNSGWVGEGRVPVAGLPGRDDDFGVSVVVPVLNDRGGLEELLEALAAQTRPPDEVVIVDGGSTDGTRELAESWNSPFRCRVLVCPGVNIAQARNAGVAAATQTWIASTDAGCRPVPAWLAAIEAAVPESDFVAGVVLIEGDTPLQRLLGQTHYPQVEELGSVPLWVRASHRLFGRRYESDRAGGAYMAFRKSVWLAVGGFPEHVRAGEDRGFTAAVADHGFRMARVPEAAVAWAPPRTWSGNARMFHRYARGDVRIAGKTRHVVRASAWVVGLRALVGGRRAWRLVVAAGWMGYIALPLRRSARAGISPRQWWQIPLLVALKDLSQLAGAITGTIDGLRRATRRRD